MVGETLTNVGDLGDHSPQEPYSGGTTLTLSTISFWDCLLASRSRSSILACGVSGLPPRWDSDHRMTIHLLKLYLSFHVWMILGPRPLSPMTQMQICRGHQNSFHVLAIDVAGLLNGVLMTMACMKHTKRFSGCTAACLACVQKESSILGSAGFDMLM